MTWKAGINSVVNTFALLCVLNMMPPVGAGGALEISTFRVLVSAAGLYFAIGAWRRDFLGFVGVLTICASAAAFDAVLMVSAGVLHPLLLLNAVLYVTVGAALYSARKEFPRRR